MFDASAYDFKEIPKLTPEQEKSPFAWAYYEPVTPPSREILDACGEEQMPLEEVLDFSEIDKMILPDTKLRNGWCILPDGTAFTSVETKMPEVTLEIEKWWSQWMADPSYDWLNYRIWMPGLHESHAMPIIENLGWGMCEIYMFQPLPAPLLLQGRNPADMNPGFIAAMGASGYNVLRDDPNKEKFYAALISFIKKDGDGLKVQTINYIGKKWENGKLVKVHDADPDRVRLFLMHNAYEFHHKAVIAKKLYEFSAQLTNHGLNPDIKPMLPPDVINR